MAKPAMLMVVATLIGGGCDYLFQIYMGRTMNAGSYSELTALLSMFYLVIVPAQVVSTFLVKQTSYLRAEAWDGEIAWLMRKTMLVSVAVGAGIALAMYLLLSEISSFIYLSSTLPVFLLMAGVIVALTSPIGYGTSQGLQRFSNNAAYAITGPVAKLVLGMLLVTLGFGIAGAIGGVLINLVLAMIVTLFFVRDYFGRERVKIPEAEMAGMRESILSAIIAVTCLTIMLNIDIVLARQYLDPNTAGVYSVCSVLGKIILFLPSSINIVIYPKLAHAHVKKTGTVAMMRLSVLVALAVTGIAVLLFFLVPGDILRFLYGGDKYIGAASALGIMGLAMALFGTANLFMNYGLAINSRIYLAIMVFFTVLQVSLIMLFHETIVTIALDLLVTSAGTTLVSWAYMELVPVEQIPDVPVQ